MKATIQPPVYREVTLTMSEEDARFLFDLFSKLTEKGAEEIVGRNSPRPSNGDYLSYRLYDALYKLWQKEKS